MKDNYYSLKNTKRAKNIQSRQQSNYRKRKNKKLNYKKVFIFFIVIFILFYLLINGTNKLFSFFSKENNKTATASVEAPKDITINMAIVGDIMCHSTNFQSAYNSETDSYDFSNVFTDINHTLKVPILQLVTLKQLLLVKMLVTVVTPLLIPQNHLPKIL